MRIKTAAAAIAAALATTLGLSGSAPAQNNDTDTCTWQRITLPANVAWLNSVQVLSPHDVMLSGADLWQRPWLGRWDGKSLQPTPQIPKLPDGFQFTGDLSFDSASDGWLTAALYTGRSTIANVTNIAERWHDGRWTMTPMVVSPNPNTVRLQTGKIASVSATDAWSVGYYSDTFGYVSHGALIEHWDGTQWNIIPNPADNQPHTKLRGITAVSATDIWAYGHHNDTNGKISPFAEHWNGSTWQVIPTPTGNSPAAINAITVVDGQAWAVGVQTQQGTTNTAVPLIEHWDGHKWTEATGLPDIGNSRLYSVYAASPSDVWATAGFPKAAQAQFLHWDGHQWTAVAAPGPQEFGLAYGYAAIAGSGPHDIYAAGHAGSPSGFAAELDHLTCR